MNAILLVISMFGGDELPTVYDICGEPCPVRIPDYRLPTTSTEFIPDINGDCTVDISDLGLILSVWGVCKTDCCREDLNRDGVVDVIDLTRVISKWTLPSTREGSEERARVRTTRPYEASADTRRGPPC